MGPGNGHFVRAKDEASAKAFQSELQYETAERARRGQARRYYVGRVFTRLRRLIRR